MNSKIILGTVQMGVSYGVNNTSGKIAIEDSFNILACAYDNGVEVLDTAEAYGNAHEVIGFFHEKYPSKKFKVISKLPHVFDENISEKVNDYLKELRIDRLEALLFHSFSSYKNNLENFDDLRKLKRANKIKNIGVSVYTNTEMEEVLLNDEIDIIQLPFNLLDNMNLRGEVIAKAKAKGKIIHTRSALLQGLFFKEINDKNATVKLLKSELGTLASIAKKEEVSISKLAISYCLQQEMINNVLIGVDSIGQLEDNFRAVNYTLNPDAIHEINSILVSNTDLLNPSLWK